VIPERPRVLVVANPTAGLRRGIDAGEAVVRAARPLAAAVTLARTEEPGHARRLAAAAASDGFDVVAAVGGDGTAHEVANGLAGTTAALAVAPAGTMNLLARVLELPLDPARAVERALARGRLLPIRPGRADGALFLLMAGIGLDAWVLRGLLERTRGKIDFPRYVLGALSGMRTYAYPRIRLEGAEEPLTATSAIVGRAPLYGGFLRPTPRASLERDLLELCALDLPGAFHYLRVMPSLWSGAHHGRPGVACMLLSEIRATSDDPDVPVQLDGEPFGRLPMTFDVSDRALRILV
jgi:YegS/Rv2252/BmrU family lipid kinase